MSTKNVVMERVAVLFAKNSTPSGAKKVFEESKSPEELISGLRSLMATNESQSNEIEGSVDSVERILSAEEARVKAGLGPRLERAALLKIRRIRKQLDILESRFRIHERNLDLLQTLVGKIEEVIAMRLAGLDETKIDEILLAYEESRDEEEVRNSAIEAGLVEVALAKKEDEELAKIREELLGLPKKAEEKKPEPKLEKIEAPALPPRRSIDEPKIPASKVPSDEELDRELEREDRELEAIVGKKRKELE